MEKIIIFLSLLCSNGTFAQNIGIGTGAPTEKLEVNGNVKAGGLFITQGNQHDIAKKGSSGLLEFSKGNKGIGMSYIIATGGIFPPQSGGTPAYSNTIIGEIRLFAGSFAPLGFMFCHGQLLSLNNNLSLFSVLGTTYGGNGTTHFALPDLRGAVPVGFGAPATGASWLRGEVN